MCIHGFVKFMQNLCSDLKVLRRIQGGLRVGDDGNVVNLSFSKHFLHQKLCHFEIKSIKTIFSTTTLTSPQNK